jgi:hypothetical protein
MDQFPRPDSFVVETDAPQKAQIEAIYAEGHVPQFWGHVASGTVDYNENYYAPGNPVWNWYFSSVEGILDQNDQIVPPDD